eukprot:TRINITY_DN574_c0_g9_i1.p1 TRINITY_DN574_c0_g9~~TRINITY_DN574_c0_g9_i1.p1  ORF type:complete len:316 (+),score=98.46 TRINITY_DN574_c0_g9_i1:483-1430(+)
MPLTDEQNELMEILKDKVFEFIDQRVEETKDNQMTMENYTEGDIYPPWTELDVKQAKKFVGHDLIQARFLRARGWDMDQATDMLCKCVQWRRLFQNIGVDNITFEMCENELKTGKQYFHKFDKENRPISYIRCRYHDAGSRDLEELCRYSVWVSEYGRKLLPPGIHQSTLCFDLGGWSLKCMDYQFMKFMIEIAQNYFPDSLGQCLIVNSPWLFKGCWKILKGWIDPDTVKKVHFVDTYANLQDYIDVESIPAEYGGDDPYEWEYSPELFSLRDELLNKEDNNDDNNDSNNNNNNEEPPKKKKRKKRKNKAKENN